jgi:hypothetical protein
MDCFASLAMTVSVASLLAMTGAAYRSPHRPPYSAASTALAISAVPLLPPNSIDLMPSA